MTIYSEQISTRCRSNVGDHGHSRSRQLWGSTGIATGQVGWCNTFTAPSNQVR